MLVSKTLDWRINAILPRFYGMCDKLGNCLILKTYVPKFKMKVMARNTAVLRIIALIK